MVDGCWEIGLCVCFGEVGKFLEVVVSEQGDLDIVIGMMLKMFSRVSFYDFRDIKQSVKGSMPLYLGQSA